jgi:adenosylcobyric acid synthase
VPYLHHLGLEEEDSVAVQDRRTAQRVWQVPFDSHSPERPLRIGVIAVPHMSNFTDFDALAAEPSISLAFLERSADVAHADFIILPGSKQTLDDLEWLRQNGFFQRLSEHHAQRKGILGICGGLQMLGTRIDDPQGIENDGIPIEQAGLGLLPIETVLRSTKTTRPVKGSICADSFRGRPWPIRGFEGYEIHMGETRYLPGASPLARVSHPTGESEWLDGAIDSDGTILGTYVHGIFDVDEWRHSFIDLLRASAGLSVAWQTSFVSRERDARLNRLADHLRKSLDVSLILSWIGRAAKPTARLSAG